MPKLKIIGGGLAGCEAAWQALSLGYDVTLYEMRPSVSTAAHKTGDLAELVCSNSLKSMVPATAPGQLKSEMSSLESLIIAAGMAARVPAGQALAVNREIFSSYISESLQRYPGFKRVDCEMTTLPSEAELQAADEALIIATGPLTSPGLIKEIDGLCGDMAGRLHFYDAIAPVLEADSIDMDCAFWASRYGKNDQGQKSDEVGDYLNIPLNKEEYYEFVDAIASAEYMPLHSFEDTKYFESCLPVEVMVGRGRETLRFGPMKPVGLDDPRTGRWPYANIQLRLENVERTMVSMVGFQTKMKWPEQKRVFGSLNALKDAEFLRFGSVHRNTYVQSPKVLNTDLSFKANSRIFLAGQITGVEGYTESAAIGLIAGRFAAAKLANSTFTPPPASTMLGALHQYVVKGPLGDYQPMNANLGLLPPTTRQKRESKADKKARQCFAATEAFTHYLKGLNAGGVSDAPQPVG